MDFPFSLPPGASGVLSFWNGAGPGVGDAGFATNTYTANAAIYMEVFTPVPLTIFGFGWENGSAVSGNIDVGLYDLRGARLGHTGSTAQAGTSTGQTAAVSGGSFSIAAGCYCLAFAIDNATGAVYAQTSVPAIALQLLGVFGQATAFPLPATATFAAPAQTKVPLVGAFTSGSTF